MEEKVNRKRFLLSVATFLLFFGLMVFAGEETRRIKELESPNVPSSIDEPDVKGADLNITCSSNNACGTPAYGGCVFRNPCYSSEYQCPSIPGLCCGRGPCTDTCDPCVGNHQSSNNGCRADSVSCAIYDCYSQCGTNTAQCYPKKYTLSYSAGTGGTITGTTTQSVCYYSYGTQVTAVANNGYLFQKWSDNITTASRTDRSTGNLSVSAIFIVDSTNNPPTAPTSPFTNGATNPTGVNTLTPYFSAIFNDPDTGNTGVHYQIQVNTNSSFSGTVMWDSTKSAMSATAIGVRSPNITYAGTTLSLNGTTYYWRIKFWDNKGADGPWSSTAQFTMNTAPTAPTSLLTNGATNPTDIPSNPYFSAIFNDADSGNTGVHYQIQVNTNSSYTGTIMWDTGKTSMSATASGARSPNITYAGNEMSYNGTTYYWRIRFWDNLGTMSAWSANAQFTTATAPSAPTLLRTNGSTNPTNVIPSPAPYFSAIFNHTNSSRRGVYYQIIMTESDGTAFWDSGKTAMTSTAPGSRSPNISYSGSAPLDHDGSTYKWKIYFWDDLGLISPISAEAQFTMNTRPTPPTGLLTEGLTNPTGVTDLTPEFSAIYQDMSGKTAVYYQIQVNSNSLFTGATMWDSGKTAMSAISPGTRMSDVSYDGSTLSENGYTYYWRIKFWDNRGGDGEWSEINSFQMKKAVTTYTVASHGTQLPTVPMESLGASTYMGGVFSFTKYFVGMIETATYLNSITLNRSWSPGSGSITGASLYYKSVLTAFCPSEPSNVSLYRSYTNSNGLTFPLTFTSSPTNSVIISRTNKICIYVYFTFDSKKTINPGDVLDFEITNFVISPATTERYGFPSNISGTTKFKTPPTFSSMSNTGPSDPGNSITFQTGAYDYDGDNVKLVVCKTPGVTGTACDGGSSDTYCTSSLTSSNPSCSWNIPSPYPDNIYYAYPYIFDSDNRPSEDYLQGLGHKFYVNNVAPTPTGILINSGEDIFLVTEDTQEVPITITVQDNNGCANDEIASVKAYLYRSGIGYSSCKSIEDKNYNNCYPELTCTYITNSCNNNTATYSCSADLEYYADPTETNSPFSSESWIATAKATDDGFTPDGTNPQTGTYTVNDGPDVNALLAFNISTPLSYGIALAGEATPFNTGTTITSAGNIALNHLLSGVDMCDDFPDCLGNTIPVSQQRYALSSDTDYEEANPIYSSPQTVQTGLPKQTTSTPTSVTIWWGILVPEGTPIASYEGLNTITSSINYVWML